MTVSPAVGKEYMTSEYPRESGHGMLLVQLHGQAAGQPWAPVGARRMLARAGKRAGLGAVKPHAFRHSFTSAVLDASGGNLVIARDAGGWASAAMVDEVYGARRRARSRVRRRAAHGLGRGAVTGSPAAAAGCPRGGRDRLEILTALISAPSFDLVFRPDIIKVPAGHPVYRWDCVAAMRAAVLGRGDLCAAHQGQWAAESERGRDMAAFVTGCPRPGRAGRRSEVICRICPDGPLPRDLRLCHRHLFRWNVRRTRRVRARTSRSGLSQERPCPGYGRCGVVICPELADSPAGIVRRHDSRYRRDGAPGGAAMPGSWWQRYEQCGKPVPLEYADQPEFRRWCATVSAQPWPGQINLRGLRPLVRAEIQWGLFMHTQRARPSRWDLGWIRALVTTAGPLR